MIVVSMRMKSRATNLLGDDDNGEYVEVVVVVVVYVYPRGIVKTRR